MATNCDSSLIGCVAEQTPAYAGEVCSIVRESNLFEPAIPRAHCRRSDPGWNLELTVLLEYRVG